MQHFIQVPRLSHSIALFLSLENEVGCLFKLMRMGGGGGGGGLQARVSHGTLPKFSSANFFSANWVNG